MELKRIVGPDVKTALRLVREQLGPDAMILSNRRVPTGVEIVAAPDSASAALASAQPRRQEPPPVPRHEAAPPPGVAARREEATSPQLLEVQSELRSIRAFLEQRLGELPGERAAPGPGIEGRIWRRLTRIGIPNALVRDLVAGTDAASGWDSAWRLALARLASRLREAQDPVSAGGVWAFVGPTGAGKTTTICKLAVRHVLAHGPEGVALLSMDASRLGGSDMLRAVARLLGVPFHGASGGESLEKMLRRVRGSRLVLVDTAGCDRKFRRDAEQLAELGALRQHVGTLLVLPANVQLACLEAAVADFGACAPVAAVVTKLDETTSLGEVIGLLARERLPVAYSTDGQEIPDDLRVASAADLVEHAVGLDAEGTSGFEDAVPAAPAGPSTTRDASAARGHNAARIA